MSSSSEKMQRYFTLKSLTSMLIPAVVVSRTPAGSKLEVSDHGSGAVSSEVVDALRRAVDRHKDGIVASMHAILEEELIKAADDLDKSLEDIRKDIEKIKGPKPPKK